LKTNNPAKCLIRAHNDSNGLRHACETLRFAWRNDGVFRPFFSLVAIPFSRAAAANRKWRRKPLESLKTDSRMAPTPATAARRAATPWRRAKSLP